MAAKVAVYHLLACAVRITTCAVLGDEAGVRRSSQFDSGSVFMHYTRFAPYDARVTEMGLGRFSLRYLFNYLYYAPYSRIGRSGRLLASTRLLEKKVKDLHMTGKAIAHLPYGKVAVIGVIGQGWKFPYSSFEVLRNGQLSYMDHTAISLEMKNENQKQSFLWLYPEPEISEIVALAERGYFLVIFDSKMVKKLNHLTELQGKWVPLDDIGVTIK